eukprot:NODE_262_length_12566_cov_0.133392.p5 type:complete len:349 gc:universal NODE_262_length_12566_cov_0.133392:4467-3421(-)
MQFNYDLKVNPFQVKKKNFDLSPVQVDSKTRSGLTMSNGKQQGIGNLIESDFRINKALHNMIQERSTALNKNNKIIRNHSDATLKRPKSKRAIPNNSHLKQDSRTNNAKNKEDDLKGMTLKLLEMPKYKSMTSIQASNIIDSHPKSSDVRNFVEDSEKIIRANVDCSLNKVSEIERAPKPNLNLKSSSDPFFQEDKVFSLTKSGKTCQKSEIQRELQNKRMKIQRLLDGPAACGGKNNSTFTTRIYPKDPLIHIIKNAPDKMQKSVEINPVMDKDYNYKVGQNIVEFVKTERSQRIKYLKSAVDNKEWHLIQRAIMELRYVLLDSVCSEVDSELEQLVDTIIQKEFEA